MTNSISEIQIQKLIESLLRKSKGDIKTFVTDVKTHVKINDTEAISHCYVLNLDGNGRPRVNDLAEFVASHIIEYSIPRKDIGEAKDYDLKNNTTTAMMRLAKTAQKLFVSMGNTGEGGEMLLYILVQEFLKYPQLICKMSLKTNPDVHVHGADGVHISAEVDANGADVLCLHWGESKLYKNIGEATKKCIEGIKEFLLSQGGSDARTERDLQLIQANINTLDDKRLENLLVKYFDKNDPSYNNVKFKGVCLIGFNSKHYPSGPNTETIDEIKIKMETEVATWLNEIKTNITQHKNLETFEIHIFLIPFPSVQAFRDAFLKELS